MKNILLASLMLFSTLAFAESDVCCVSQTTSGESVRTSATPLSPADCKPGVKVQDKTVCAAIPDPENLYCSNGKNQQDRCGKCGFFWTGSECLTVDPKEKAKKELAEEAKKKEADANKDSDKKDSDGNKDSKPATVKPVEPTPAPKPAQ